MCGIMGRRALQRVHIVKEVRMTGPGFGLMRAIERLGIVFAIAAVALMMPAATAVAQEESAPPADAVPADVTVPAADAAPPAEVPARAPVAVTIVDFNFQPPTINAAVG